MIVDPTDPRQGITTAGDLAAQVFFLPAGADPTGDLSNAVFIGLTESPMGEAMQSHVSDRGRTHTGRRVTCVSMDCAP